jgi:N-acetylmuramoyl-L-alanine amidase
MRVTLASLLAGIGAALFLGRAAAGGPTIVDRLMPESFSSPRPPGAVVDTIMIHFSSDVVARPDDPYDVGRVVKTFEGGKASAHFLIDRAGTIYRLVPEARAAWHAGKGELPFEPRRKDCLNATSIGIELLGIGSKEDMKLFLRPGQYERIRPELRGFTDAQYAALGPLVEDLRARFPAIEKDRRHVVAHSEYAPGRRTDPGELFDWTRIGLPHEAPARAK